LDIGDVEVPAAGGQRREGDGSRRGPSDRGSWLRKKKRGRCQRQGYHHNERSHSVLPRLVFPGRAASALTKSALQAETSFLPASFHRPGRRFHEVPTPCLDAFLGHLSFLEP